MINKETPEGQYLLVVWRTMMGMAGPISEQYRWMLAGIAGILAVVIANLPSIQAMVHDGFFKFSLFLLITSLFLVAIAYLLSVALRFRNEVTIRLEQTLGSPAGKTLWDQIEMDKEELQLELRKPFFGPLGWIMKGASRKAELDPFANEKGSIRLIVWQAYSMWGGMILAVASMLTLMAGLR